MTQNSTAHFKKKPMISKASNVITTFILLLSIGLFALSIYISMVNSENPNDAFLLGYKPIYVKTDSMEPTILEGSVLIVKQTDYSEASVGDIIMYEYDEKLIVHRVSEKTEEGIRTSSDKSNQLDAYILKQEHVKGEVTHILNWIPRAEDKVKSEDFKEKAKSCTIAITATASFTALLVLGVYRSMINSRKVHLNKFGERHSQSEEETDETYYCREEWFFE